jgi:hypothetical protein
MFKRVSFLAVLFVMFFCGVLQAQTLDDAIKNAASEMSGRLQNGSTIAVISFQSQSVRLTDYVIDELNNLAISLTKVSWNFMIGHGRIPYDL